MSDTSEEYVDVDVTSYPIDDERLDRDYTYHPPAGDDQVARYTVLRSAAHLFARGVMQFTPPSREQSLALTKVEEAVMWANAAIARNE
jgi:hypothetical protein